MITYLKGDATSPVGDGNKFIIHCVNCIGKWGKGFVLAVSRKWPGARHEYLRQYHNFKLGDVQMMCVVSTPNNSIILANLFGQYGIYPVNGKSPIDYAAIEKGFNHEEMNRLIKAMNATVHMPRIGCGLAGGDWSIIEDIINRTFIAKGIDVYVYDYKR